MKSFAIERLRVAALLLALLPVSANSFVLAETWPAWMKSSQGANEFESQLSMARLNERHGQHEAATKIYVSVLAKQPNNQLAHHRLAVMAALGGDFETADQHFAGALKAGPSSAELLGDMGYALFLQNRLDEAEETLRKTITQFPSHKKAHNSLGMVLGAMGRYEEALAEFRQVVGEAEAHANLAFVMVQAGQLEQSSRHYHEAIKLDPHLRPAAEALVQLHGHVPGESSPLAPKSATARKANAVATTRTAQSRSMAKPAVSSQVTMKSQNTSDSTISAEDFLTDANVQLSSANLAANDGRHQANPIPQVASPFAPQTPTVPTQAEASFGPAVMGLAQPDRLKPGIKSTVSAHDRMIANNEKKAVDSSKTSEISPPINSQSSELKSQNIFGSSESYRQPVAPGQPESTPQERIRSQVFNYEPTPVAQVLASDETAEVETDSTSHAQGGTTERFSAEVASTDEANVEPKAFAAPGAYALAAARAQADLLSQAVPKQAELESSSGLTGETLPIPATSASDNQFVAQGQPIESAVSSANARASMVSFILAPATATSRVAEQASTETLSADETTSAIKQTGNSTNATNNLAPWQIVILTMAGMLGLVAVGKAVKFIGRRLPRSSQTVDSPVESAATTKRLEVQKYDVEETYTYLESQIRDVCAGLSTHRTAERSRGRQV